MPDNHTKHAKQTDMEMGRVAHQTNISHTPRAAEPIAVIGMGCRFPGGANSPEAFWQLLRNEKNVSSDIPENRWPLDEFYDPDPKAAGKCYTRTGHFLSNPSPAEFDADFFRITPREAQVMDPQQRILLEVVWEALENASIAPSSLSGSNTGVYIGCYDNHHLTDFDLRSGEDVQFYMATSATQSITVGRISYFLNLHGPNYAVNTACSSSLVALHQACWSLRSHECNLALTGGVSVMVSPSFFIGLAKAKMLSPDGLCKAFDNAADGYGRGEGCGVVVLKRLGDALRDRDQILACIRGSAINHDGRTAGITAPSHVAQQKVIEIALRNSNLTPADIHYVEAHGTGTAIGDPIELAALSQAFIDRPNNDRLQIGSVKTNIGHLEAAAGIAGVIKTILALTHEYLPSHLNVTHLNEHIDWDETPISVLLKGESWPSGGQPRYAGVSSFGYGGSNAHVILEGAEGVIVPEYPIASDKSLHVLTLSARDEEGLSRVIHQYAAHLKTQPASDLRDTAYTTHTGRDHMDTRAAILGETIESITATLENYTQGTPDPNLILNTREIPTDQQIGFLFTGQGAQYPGMGKLLYESIPSFHDTLNLCDQILTPLLGQSLIDILYNTEVPRHHHPINETALTQPALFAMETALAKMLISWGIKPSVVMGHSLGESAAAHIAGVLSLEDALGMVAKRGALMQSLPQNGSMVAVSTDAKTVSSTIADYAEANALGIAAFNGPQSQVISGECEAVEIVAQSLRERGIKTTTLRVSHAFHSSIMAPMVKPFETYIHNINLHLPELTLVSSVTGDIVRDEITRAEHWGRGIRQPVRFHQAITSMYNLGIRIFIEIGPHPVLTGMGSRCFPDDSKILWLPALRMGHDDWSVLMDTMGQLYVHGIDIDWDAFHQDSLHPYHKISLPTYPFKHKKHWLDGLEGKYDKSFKVPTIDIQHPLLGHQQQIPGNHSKYYLTEITPSSPHWIHGHQFFEHAILPATAYLEIAFAMGFRQYGTHRLTMQNVSFRELLNVSKKGTLVQNTLLLEDAFHTRFEIYSHPSPTTEKEILNWTMNADGQISVADEHPAVLTERVDIKSRLSLYPHQWSPELFYESFALQGLDYGQSFQLLENIRQGNGECIAHIVLPENSPHQDAYHYHPALMDGAMQLAGIVLPSIPIFHNNIPTHIDKVVFIKQQLKSLWCICKLRGEESNEQSIRRVDITYYDDDGYPVLQMEGITFQVMSRDIFQITGSNNQLEWIYKTNWQEYKKAHKETSSSTAQRWVVFADSHGFGDILVQHLCEANQRCISVIRGEQFAQKTTSSFVINPHKAEDYVLLLDAITASNDREVSSQYSFVYLWNQDILSPSKVVDILPAILHADIGPVLHLLQAIINEERAFASRLVFVTKGAQIINKNDHGEGLFQTPLWGVVRTIQLEHPELQCQIMDVDPSAMDHSIGLLIDDLLISSGETEITYRKDKRLCRRLVNEDEGANQETTSQHLVLPRTTNYNLRIGQRGLLDTLYLSPTTIKQLQPNEIEIAVRATGLNFIDILDAMGLLPLERPAFGGECAGEITAVGSAVTQFQVGDRVVALVPGGFSHYTIASEELTSAIPASLSYEQAASIPIVYLTAQNTLNQLANMKAGDRVLIHAAAGGVGFAAMQLAKQAVAEIYTTASPSKWEFLRNQGMQHIMNSRTSGFGSQIMDATDGKGVDIVLNSLSGDFIQESLSTLAENGRFIEIGKRGIWSQSRIHALRPDIDYRVYDLITHMVNAPAEVGETLRHIISQVAERTLEIPPITAYPLQQAREAFRFMQQAKHLGKIVITQDDVQSGSPKARRDVVAEATYLITGGFGALGIYLANWLAARGAYHIVLLGRRGPDESTAERIERIRRIGILVTCVKADVTDYHTLSDIFAQIKASPLPLRGVFHLAGVLDDSVIQSLTIDQVEKVMRPKVQGAWNLHLLTRDMPLDFFVMYSSTASVFGSPGQANYAAANSFLDHLASYRQHQGLAGLSINWGAWSDGGMATRTGVDQSLADIGIIPISPRQGMHIYQHLIANDFNQAVVFPVDWETLSSAQFTLSPLIETYVKKTQKDRKQNLVLHEILAAPRGLQRSKLATYVRGSILYILRAPATTPIKNQDAFSDLGIDSLMAIELRNHLQTGLDTNLPATLLINYPTLDALVDFLAKKIGLIPPSLATDEVSDLPESNIDDLDTLSEEELQLRLNEKLDQLEKM